MMDPAYASMYGSYEQMGMSQAGYGTMPPSGFSSKEELKQHASTYVQQQLAMMANGGGSSSMAYSGSGWADGSTAGTAAAAAAGAAPKKSGRGRGRPPGSKNRNNNTDAATDAAAAAAAAATEATAAEQHHYQQQQQYSMTARTSQDEAATWCSTGMMLAGSTAAGAPQGSPGGEAHSSATYMIARHMASSGTAAAVAAGPGADPLDPAALAAAPIPLACGGPSDAATAAGAHAAAADADGAAAGPECCGLLGTSAAAAAELNRIPVMPGFRVSMSGLEFELEAAGGGGSCVRFSSRSLKLLEYEDGGACMPGYKPSYSSMDFRNSLTSFDEILGHNAAHRMSDHTHVAMRGPSWDGAGSSPRSQPADATAVAAVAGTLAAPGVAAAAATAADAAAAGYAHGSSEADNALTAAFKQQQQQQAAPQQGLAAPPGSSSILHGPAWVAAQQPPNSAAAAAAAAAASVPAGLGSSLSGVHSGSFTFPAVTIAQEDIHPGAIAGPTAGGAGAAGNEATPFSAAPLQAAPFSPAGAAAVTSAVLAASQAADVQSAGVAQLTEQAPASQPMGPQAAMTAAGTDTGSVPPVAPRMPPAFHSVLQALQPPAASLMGVNSSSTSAAAAAGLPVGSGGMQHVKLEQHQQVQQPLGRDSALAAASPAITGLSAAAAGNACAPSSLPMSQVSGFMLPAAAGHHHHHHLGGRQQQQQMPMPMPLPPQLLLPPQHQQLPGHRVSDLHMGPLPSPIDLFHGDHGLHHDDLLIGTEDVFDERMLCTGSNAQQQQHTQQHQQHQHQPAQQVAYAGMSALQLVNQSFGRSCSSAATGGHGQLQQAGTTAAAVAARAAGPHPAAQGQRVSTNPCGAGGTGVHHNSVMAPSHTAGPAAAGHQEQPDATSKQGVKRSRSSANGSTWAKRQRQSEGSLVEVCTASHGMDDCLLWHHD